MKNPIKILKKNYKKLKKSVYFKAKFIYTKYYETLPVIDDIVLIQSYDGTSISGNPYYILQELCTNKDYKKLKIYVVSTWGNYNNNLKFIENKEFENVEVIKIHSEQYCKILAQAKYLINNSTFAPYFIKREEQIYLNTWHGTPLKNLGRKIHDAPNEIGNTQRNFLMADYLLYPNEFTFEHMKDDYMLSKFYNGKYVIAGYPRNSAFFDEQKAAQIREALSLENKKIVVYMPTWRGNLKNKKSDKQYVYMMHTLYEISNKLDKDTVLFVKGHSLTKSRIRYSEFENVKAFPNDFETYEFLNIADCLITDYSSVFFDYANTGKKIILYGYDKDEYLEDKGMYIDFDKLPFSFASDAKELLYEINNIDKYNDYSEFNKIYTKYDSINTPKEICSLFFNSKASENMKVIDGRTYHNDNPNVFIFGGSIAKNGITTALKGLLNNADSGKYNFVLTFYKSKTERNKRTINEFNMVDYMPIQGGKDFTYFEAICNYLYFRFDIQGPLLNKVMKKVYTREYKRLYPGIDFDYAIHYSGYEKQIMHLIRYMNAKKIIYIHNDMKKEEKSKGNFDPKSFKKSLEEFDNIVCIRESSKDEIISYHQKINPDKVIVAHNINNINDIQRKSNQELVFDDNTYCNKSLDDVKNIIFDDSKEKFVNIGRYSPEKGHERLIKTFIKYQKNNPDSYLIIIGGDGIAFRETKQLVEECENDNIVIIRLITNPYPILAQADLFILSSFYEGLPMTIMEALILDKIIVSTDIPGPSEFLSKGYGYLVENSEDGLLRGMNDYKSGKIKNLKKFDAHKFNENAIKEFQSVLN